MSLTTHCHEFCWLEAAGCACGGPQSEDYHVHVESMMIVCMDFIAAQLLDCGVFYLFYFDL